MCASGVSYYIVVLVNDSSLNQIKLLLWMILSVVNSDSNTSIARIVDASRNIIFFLETLLHFASD